jgi:hypothetical protein
MILGIIKNKEDKVINHRSLFKVIINPICRMFGFCFATYYDGKELKQMRIKKCKVSFNLWERYKLEDGDIVIKERVLI